MTSREIMNAYYAECEDIARQCAEEGYPSHGSNYDLRTERLWDEWYAEDYENALRAEAKKYWLDTDYIYGNDKPKFALHRVLDDDFDQIILWASYEDAGIDTKADEADWDALNEFIEQEIGFLPDYEIN